MLEPAQGNSESQTAQWLSCLARLLNCSCASVSFLIRIPPSDSSKDYMKKMDIQCLPITAPRIEHTANGRGVAEGAYFQRWSALEEKERTLPHPISLLRHRTL